VDTGLYEANARDIAAAMALLRRVLNSMEENHGRIFREMEEAKTANIAERTQPVEEFEETQSVHQG